MRVQQIARALTLSVAVAGIGLIAMPLRAPRRAPRGTRVHRASTERLPPYRSLRADHGTGSVAAYRTTTKGGPR
jgi:hypothetical protein